MDAQLKEKLLSLPTSSGVYLMKDKFGNVIYVGKAKNLKRRVNSYFIGNDKPIKTFNLVSNIATFDYIVTASDTDAFLLENNLIKKYQPHFNILLKDGKNYPYLKINLKDDYPKLDVTRKVKNDGAKYFGPYFNGISVVDIQKIVARAFSIRTCNLQLSSKKPIRPCINYQMGLCSAPCANYISQADYRAQIDEVIKFLKGDTKNVEAILMQKMEQASDAQNYERAIEIREEIKCLNKLKQRYTTQFPTLFSQDVVGYYCSGTNAVFTVMIIRSGKLMGVENFTMIDLKDFASVASTFLMQYYSNSRQIPKKIVLPLQISDQAELQEYLTNQSGVPCEIVVAQKGKNKKLCDLATQNGKEYLEKSLGVIKTRQMKTIGAVERLQQVLSLPTVPYRIECYDISHISGTNAVASMVVFLNGDVAKSHYRKFIIKSFEGNDDFLSMQEVLTRRIVLDGGKGQLSSVEEIFKKLGVNIPLCSLAKQDEEIYVLNQSQPIVLPKSDVALQLLQRVRDEAHRFAITFHRSRRGKAMTKSALDDIKGIGDVKKHLLYKKFGTLQNIKNASVSELMLVKGVTEAEAVDILNKLNAK